MSSYKVVITPCDSRENILLLLDLGVKIEEWMLTIADQAKYESGIIIEYWLIFKLVRRSGPFSQHPHMLEPSWLGPKNTQGTSYSIHSPIKRRKMSLVQNSCLSTHWQK